MIDRLVRHSGAVDGRVRTAAHGPLPQRADGSSRTAASAAGLRLLLLPDLPEGHSPEGALKRALLPGWGQIYNRQYYKLPFVYLGIGAFIGGVVWYSDRYILYRHAALFRQWEEDIADGELQTADPEWARYEEAYIEVTGSAASAVPSARIRSARDNLRRNRDLLVIGSVLYYGLTVLDAYVSAHLVAFDIGEELSAAVHLDPFEVRPRLTLRTRL